MKSKYIALYTTKSNICDTKNNKQKKLKVFMSLAFIEFLALNYFVPKIKCNFIDSLSVLFSSPFFYLLYLIYGIGRRKNQLFHFECTFSNCFFSSFPFLLHCLSFEFSSCCAISFFVFLWNNICWRGERTTIIIFIVFQFEKWREKESQKHHWMKCVGKHNRNRRFCTAVRIHFSWAHENTFHN